MRKNIFVLFFVLFFIVPCVFASSDTENENDSDDSIYLNSYDDINNAMQTVDYDSLYKEAYNEQLNSSIEYYNNRARDEIIKAKVLSAGKEQDYYYADDYYDVYKITYQDIRVKILEGKLKGQEFDSNYILSADKYDNILVEPVSEGKIVNVVVSGDDAETAQVIVTTLDASVYRFSWIIAIIIIMMIFIALFLGKAGLKILPLLILLCDVILFIFIPEVFTGRSIWWLLIVSSILYILAENAIKLGFNLKMVASIIATISVTLIVIICFALLNKQMMMSGITLEIANIAEMYPVSQINLYSLNLSTFAWMLVVIVSNISCQTVRVFTENDEDEAKKKIQKYVSGMIPIIVIMTLALSIQKILYLVASKYTINELLNSEILFSELLRGMFLVIAATITTVVAQVSKKLLI